MGTGYGFYRSDAEQAETGAETMANESGTVRLELVNVDWVNGLNLTAE